MTNLARIVQDARSARGEWLAVRQGELALTYAELAHANGQAAGLLRDAGVGPGDRVALMLLNVLAFSVSARTLPDCCVIPSSQRPG